VNLENSQLWLISAGLTLFQILVGSVMVFYGVLPYLLGIHALLAVVLLALSVYGYTKVKVNIERRILIGNVGLIILISALGYLYLSSDNSIIVIIHFFLALGLLSNFSVLYGFERGQKYK
jgi:heme A synthase